MSDNQAAETAKLPARITKAADAARTAQTHYRDALEGRDRIICEAVDQGVSVRAAARAAGLSDSAVMKVLSGSGRFQD